MRVAIIPARGGSKGVPRKNLQIVGGETLIARCVRTCVSAGLEACVSTDDEEIAEESRHAGARVVYRPQFISDDQASSQEAIGHALTHYKQATEVLFAQCTSPMLTTSDIHGTLDALHGNDLAICCVEFDGIVLDCDGSLVNQPQGYCQRRQCRAPQYMISGHCWAFRPEYLGRPWMSGRIGIHVASYPHRIDIDTPADLELARLVIEEPVCYPI